MSCSVIDRRSNEGGNNSGCRLRGSSASLATSSGAGKGPGGAQATTSSGSVFPAESSTTNNPGGGGGTGGGGTGSGNNNANAPLRPAKPCCFCWCCCCSCSWNKCLMKGVDENGPTKNPNNKDLLNCDGGPPPTLEEIRSWGKSFDKLMRSAAGRKVFRDFLRCEYSEENILFWLACEELKKECNPDVVEEKARFIYEDYISILSPKEVSLDSRVREIVNRNMMEPTTHTFDEAQLQIYTLMHRDSYPRFVNSPLYKKLAQINGNGCGGNGADTTSTGGGDNDKKSGASDQKIDETKPSASSTAKQTDKSTSKQPPQSDGEQQKATHKTVLQNATVSETEKK